MLTLPREVARRSLFLLKKLHCRVPPNRCYGVQVVPALSTFGLPEASTRSSEVPESFPEVLRQLQGRAAQGPLREAQEVEELVDQSLSLLADARLEELAQLAECFVQLRLRKPLKDLAMSLDVALKLQGAGAEALPFVVRLIRATGQGSLFLCHFFDHCNEHLGSLQAKDLAMYIYESGRHGLRCRHLMPAAVRQATAMARQFDLEDTMRAWQGFLRFSKENRSFYMAVRNQVQRQVASLCSSQLLLVQRAARDLHSCADLHAAACAEMQRRLPKLALSEAAACLAHCTFKREFRPQASALVRAVVQHWNERQDLHDLKVVEVVDALVCIASWDLRPLPVLGRLDEILVDRQVELKYTGNVLLWVFATRSLSRMQYRDSKWALVALDLARDKIFLEQVPFHHLCQLLEKFAELNLFDEMAYQSFAELFLAERQLFKELRDIAQVLWAFAHVGFFHPELFDALYNLILDRFEAESIRLEKREEHEDLVQAAWSLALAGYHRRSESFASFLDHVFWNIRSPRPVTLRRAAELADLALQEAPEVAKLCQCLDKVERCRSSRLPADASEWRAEVVSALEAIGQQTDASPVTLGITLTHGKALLLVDETKLLRGEAPQRWQGDVAMALRLLETRGRVAVLCEDEWRRADQQAQVALLQRLVSEIS